MDAVFSLLCVTLGIAAGVLTLPGSVLLLGLTLASTARPRSVGPRYAGTDLRLAVVVPAHDEEQQIARTVASLQQCTQAETTAIVVIADNCRDATEARARTAGARVLVRDAPEHRGKGYALDFAFQELLREGYDAFLVVDADTVVEPGLLAAARAAFAAGADAVQARYLVLAPDRSVRTRLLEVAFGAINVVRPRGRERLGLSAGIVGSGFGLTRATLARVPYGSRSIVEDLDYHLRLVRAGLRVRFLDEITVRGEMPAAGQGVRTQRARWEGGRLLVARRNVPALAADVVRGRWRLLEPLLDLCTLPLAFHSMALVVAAALPWAPSRILGLAGLGIVVLHVLTAVRLTGGGWRGLHALAAAPFYALWKIGMLGGILRAARKNAAWVRTSRDS